MKTLQDHLWLWGHEGGGHNGYDLPGKSRMTPAEGAYYMGIPNVMFIRLGDCPPPGMFDQYAISLSPMSKVAWSIIGDGGSKSNDQSPDLESVVALSEKYPNIVGGVMDDFFLTADGKSPVARYSQAEVRLFQKTLHAAKRPLDLFVVIYSRNLDLPVKDYLDACDVITYWTWKLEELSRLENDFERLRRIVPSKRKMLGIYLWAYGDNKPMPLGKIEEQCRFGLELLKKGDIEGIIFCSNCVCDLNLEAVEWTREWIRKNGESFSLSRKKTRLT